MVFVMVGRVLIYREWLELLTGCELLEKDVEFFKSKCYEYD